MGMSLRFRVVDPDVLLAAGDPHAVFEDGAGDVWDQDQLGWAAFALAAGPDAFMVLVDEGSGPPGAFAAADSVTAALAEAMAGVDRVELERRFDAGEFGSVLGIVPEAEDREWMIEAAEALGVLFVAAAESSRTVLWAYY